METCGWSGILGLKGLGGPKAAQNSLNGPKSWYENSSKKDRAVSGV